MGTAGLGLGQWGVRVMGMGTVGMGTGRFLP